LQLPSPANEGQFPYRLALKNAATGRLVTEGKVHRGEYYGLVLVRETKKREYQHQRRYVYAFTLDINGRSQLLYASSVHEDGRLPGAGRRYPPEIRLGPSQRFRISAPFGVDSYILLTTTQPIPDPQIFSFAGVRTGDRGIPAGEPAPGLPGLVNRLMQQSQGSPLATATDWSIQRLIVESTP